MVWNEKKQDRELLAFFKTLIALRREHIGLINHGVISYRHLEGLPCWEISGEGRRLSVVYAGDHPVEGGPLEEALGRGILYTGQIRGSIIPPWSTAVYYKNFPEEV
jgi:hypothetical protein